jgi:hypothetical protein
MPHATDFLDFYSLIWNSSLSRINDEIINPFIAAQRGSRNKNICTAPSPENHTQKVLSDEKACLSRLVKTH